MGRCRPSCLAASLYVHPRKPALSRAHAFVPSYVRGRVALAGDAAHVNSPAGGMGLNGGIHDAFELAAALRAAFDEGAGPERLARYDRRRRPVAEDEILAQADRNRARMRERDPGKRRALLAELQATAGDPARCKPICCAHR